ncbi:MAG: thioredoxin family protein [Fuerstiella sp.]
MQSLNLIVGCVLFGVAIAITMLVPADRQTIADPWFQSAVLENTRPVVVKFGADWCPPCRSMDKSLATLKSGFPQARFVTINIDEKPDVFRTFQSGSGIPQVAIFQDGAVVARTRGFPGEAKMKSWLQNNL